MKKILAVCFSSSLVVSVLSGCASNDTASSTTSPATTSAAATTAASTSKDDGKKVKLTVVHYMVEKPKVDTFKKADGQIH